jgi:hypothetical protein
MIKSIFYSQIILAVGCEAVALFLNYFTRPLAHFADEQTAVEKVLVSGGHFNPGSTGFSVMHYFISTLYDDVQVHFDLLQIACLALFFGGLIGLIQIHKIEKATQAAAENSMVPQA